MTQPTNTGAGANAGVDKRAPEDVRTGDELKASLSKPCLLYTSDAADDIALV